MKRLMFVACGALATFVVCGCGDVQATTAKNQQDAVIDVSKVFNDYLKSRSVALTFQAEIRSAFIKLSDEERLSVAKEMLQLMKR